MRQLLNRSFLDGMGGTRLVRLFFVSLLLWSVLLPLAGWIHDYSRYQLSPSEVSVVGPAHRALSNKITYDPSTAQWQFNKDGDALLASSIARQQGSDPTEVSQALSALRMKAGSNAAKESGSMYSVNMPSDPKEGITYFDNNTSLSFKMVPNFELAKGKKWQGRVVYPFEHGRVVYTAKNNGLKEDIVIPSYVADSLSYSYTLELPDELVAQIEPDGSLGIYSGDPVLYSNVTASMEEDIEKLKSAREQSPKTHRLFVIPPPYVKDQNGYGGKVSYRLEDGTLHVLATQLKDLTYPLTIDPSVVVTSTADFTTGNNEGNIHYDTAGQVTRANDSGGIINSWTTSGNTISSARSGMRTEIYNNSYIYALGGVTPGPTYSNAVQYAPINADGSIGVWTTLTGFTTARAYFFSAVYDDFLYIGGGDTATGGNTIIQYAKLNTNGTLAANSGCGVTWCTNTTSIPTTSVFGMGSAVYNGYVYIAGGYNTQTSMSSNTVYYAPILPGGGIGSFTGTSSLTTARTYTASVAYNGYLYTVAGRDLSTGLDTNRFDYARINPDGSLGSQYGTDSFPATITIPGISVLNGYMYIIGGSSSNSSLSTAYMSKISADGTLINLDTWLQMPSLPNARQAPATVASSSRLYVLGGYNSATTSAYNTLLYGAPREAGWLDNYRTETALGSSLSGISNGKTGGRLAVYNGCIYYVGGYTGTVFGNQVYYAPLNPNGTIGAWAVETDLMVTGVHLFGFAMYDKYMYVIAGAASGGNISTVQYTTFDTAGCGTGSWSTTTAFTGAVSQQPATAYDGYLYMMGVSGNGPSTQTNSAPINANGTIGSWTNQTPALAITRVNHQLVAYAGYLYVISGSNGTTAQTRVDYAPLLGGGTIGSWTQTTSVNTARVRAMAYGYKGYLYIIGGDNTGATHYATTEYAPVNSNGSLGTWVASGAMNSTHQLAGTAVYGDRIYIVMGNENNARSRNVYSMVMHNGGSDTVSNTGWTASVQTFPASRFLHASVASQGQLFVIGGYASGAPLSSVAYSMVGDNSVSTWSTTTALPQARDSLGAVAYKGYIYVVGGYGPGSAATNTVYSAPINYASGGVGTWTAQTSLPAARAAHQTLAYNGYIYALGGETGTDTNTVVYAAINSTNGTIGTWATASSFTNARKYFMATVAGGYMYIIGGYSAPTFYGDVQFTLINSNGTIGAWSSTNPIPGRRYDGVGLTVNGSVCVLGGQSSLYASSGLALSSDFQCAEVTESGMLGDWMTSVNKFGTPRQSLAAVLHDGYLYLTGGYASVALGDTQVARLDSIANKGQYSKQLDLGAEYTVTGISSTAVLPDGVTIKHSTAPTSGIYSVPSLTLTATISCNGIALNARYIRLYVTIEDSTYTKYPALNQNALLDVTVDYALTRAAPNQRLFGGKFYNNEVLQPLDTCGA